MGMFVIVNRFVNSTPSVPALRAALSSAPHARHYFDLAFLRDGLRFMPLNALGTRVRSHWLGMPFSDQRFAIRHAAFHSLGGFDESAPYGEDHLFVWRARRAGITVRATGSTLRTSAARVARRRGASVTMPGAGLYFALAIASTRTAAKPGWLNPNAATFLKSAFDSAALPAPSSARARKYHG